MRKTFIEKMNLRFLFNLFNVIPIIISTASASDSRDSAFCSNRAPIFFDKSTHLPILSANAELGTKQIQMRFVVYTGWSETTLSGSAAIALELSQNKSKKLSIRIGSEIFDLSKAKVEDVGLLRKFHFDGILGADLLTSRELILNLRDGYICFPIRPLSENWEEIGFRKKSSARYDKMNVWVPLTVDGRSLGEYFIDTGSDMTSLSPGDLTRLELQPIGRRVRITADGRYRTEYFGPLQIDLAGIHVSLKEAAKAPSKEYQKIGLDAVASLVIGFDPKQKLIYFAK